MNLSLEKSKVKNLNNRYISATGFHKILEVLKYEFSLRKGSIGKKPLCNLVEDRAPKFGSFVFVLCWRCTGAVVGSLFGYVLLFFFIINIPLLFSVISLLPIAIDGGIQYLYKIESTNIRRFVTGFIAGLGTTL